MADLKELARFAVKVINIHMPGNWDRPVGYDGHARFVAVYWDHAGNDVFITDGLSGRSGGAWWLHTNLVERDARREITAALMACGVTNPLNKWPLGDLSNEATHGLILDRFEHGLWVARLEEATPFLCQQHHKAIADPAAIAAALVRQKTELLEDATVHPCVPCHCDRGWKLSVDYYLPCPECQRSGRIEIIPQQAIR